MREGGVKCGRPADRPIPGKRQKPQSPLRQPKGFLPAPKLAGDNRAAKPEPLLSGVAHPKARRSPNTGRTERSLKTNSGT